MELSVRKQKPPIRSLTTEQPKEASQQPQRQSPESGYDESLSIRCNALLYNTIQNMLTAAHTVEDFTYVSVSDFIRAALLAYQDGMPLTELDKKGEPKISTTVRVDRELKAFYRSLPDRLRSQLVERAIRTFIKQ